MRTVISFLIVALAIPLTGCDREGNADLQEENLELQSEVRQLSDKIEQNNDQVAELEEQLDQARQKRRELEDEAEELERDLLEDLRKTREELATSQERLEELEAGMEAPEPAVAEEPDEEEAEEPEEPEQTENEAEKLRETMDDAARRLALLGGGLLAEGEHEPARIALLISRQLGADAPIVYYHLAAASAELQKWEAAEANYAVVVEQLHKAKDNLSGAEKNMLKAALLNAGVALEHLEDYTEAAENYVAALELDADYAPAYYNLGRLYARKLDDREKAITLLRKHVVLEGRRSDSALDLIEELQNPEKVDKEATDEAAAEE
jgi:tetratricopeptide (TPR) repeat protein